MGDGVDAEKQENEHGKEFHDVVVISALPGDEMESNCGKVRNCDEIWRILEIPTMTTHFFLPFVSPFLESFIFDSNKSRKGSFFIKSHLQMRRLLPGKGSPTCNQAQGLSFISLSLFCGKISSKQSHFTTMPLFSRILWPNS